MDTRAICSDSKTTGNKTTQLESLSAKNTSSEHFKAFCFGETEKRLWHKRRNGTRQVKRETILDKAKGL